MFSEWRWVQKWTLCFHSPGVWAEKLKDQSVNRRCVLVFPGADGEMAARQPCWSLGICVLPASLVLCVVVIFRFYLCTGEWTVVFASSTSVLDTTHFSAPNFFVFRLEAGWVQACRFYPSAQWRSSLITSVCLWQCRHLVVENASIFTQGLKNSVGRVESSQQPLF